MTPHDLARWAIAIGLTIVCGSVSIAVAAMAVRSLIDSWLGRPSGQIPPSHPPKPLDGYQPIRRTNENGPAPYEKPAMPPRFP